MIADAVDPENYMAEDQQKTNQEEAVEEETNLDDEAAAAEGTSQANGEVNATASSSDATIEPAAEGADQSADEATEPTAEAQEASAAADDSGEAIESTAPADEGGDTPAAEVEVTDAGDSVEESAPAMSPEDTDATEKTGRIGYTGEIEGRVVTLEELEEAYGEEKQTGQGYDQLMKLVDQTFTKVNEQEIVNGRVVSVGEKDAVIDIGFKSDGVVSLNEFDRELSPGDEVEVFVDRLEDYHGQLVLSKAKADQLRRWQRIEDAFENDRIIEGTIVRRIKGGMIVELDIGKMEAFLPGSQIDVRPVRDFDAYLEKRMEFKIVKLNPANENIVVSHKALIEKELEAQREKILSTMEPGQILEGTVKNITDFGVFIDLGGVDGLLHITDLSWGRVSHPSELVELDEKLNVVVLDYDKERQRISLGLKQLQPHPWEDIEEKYEEGSVVEGKVVSITDYGAFVELEKGIEGLVHISEMSWTEHIRHPSQMVSLGQLVKVKILNIDKEDKKISLGMKQLEPDPWVGIADRYPPGTVLRGTVRNITNFGVFVEIEPGIDGLVHISDLSWTKKIRHPSEMIKKGQELDVVILNVDEEARRISLGHKQVETNPWNQFAKVYAEGTDTTARAVRSNEGGLVVELPLEVEAFVPASELKHGPQNFQEFYKEGQELQLRVIKFDPNQKEIVLSEVAQDRATERAERQEQERERRERRERERRDLEEFQEREETSGPTTLGELSGLADLKAQIEEAEAREPEQVQESAAAEDATAVADEGSTPEAQAEVETEQADAASADAPAEAEDSAATKTRGRGKRKQEAGDEGAKAEGTAEATETAQEEAPAEDSVSEPEAAAAADESDADEEPQPKATKGKRTTKKEKVKAEESEEGE